MVTVGAVVTLVALTATYVVLPLARRWSDREARITLRAEQLSRLQGVLAEEAAIRASLGEAERQRREAEDRLLRGGTRAVAGSNLQLLLNRYATEAGMEVDRVDAVAAGAGDEAVQRIPARITVRGDLRGLVELLSRVQEGTVLLAVDELSVSAATSARAGRDGLTATIGVHGFALSREGSP